MTPGNQVHYYIYLISISSTGATFRLYVDGVTIIDFLSVNYMAFNRNAYYTSLKPSFPVFFSVNN